MECTPVLQLYKRGTKKKHHTFTKFDRLAFDNPQLSKAKYFSTKIPHLIDKAALFHLWLDKYTTCGLRKRRSQCQLKWYL